MNTYHFHNPTTKETLHFTATKWVDAMRQLMEERKDYADFKTKDTIWTPSK